MHSAWWRHQMETFSALLALCAGSSPVSGGFPAQRPVTQSFDIFFDLRLNKRLSKQSWSWWFETPSSPLRRNGIYWYESAEWYRYPKGLYICLESCWTTTKKNQICKFPMQFDCFFLHCTLQLIMSAIVLVYGVEHMTHIWNMSWSCKRKLHGSFLGYFYAQIGPIDKLHPIPDIRPVRSIFVSTIDIFM